MNTLHMSNSATIPSVLTGINYLTKLTRHFFMAGSTPLSTYNVTSNYYVAVPSLYGLWQLSEK